MSRSIKTNQQLWPKQRFKKVALGLWEAPFITAQDIQKVKEEARKKLTLREIERRNHPSNLDRRVHVPESGTSTIYWTNPGQPTGRLKPVVMEPTEEYVRPGTTAIGKYRTPYYAERRAKLLEVDQAPQKGQRRKSVTYRVSVVHAPMKKKTVTRAVSTPELPQRQPIVQAPRKKSKKSKTQLELFVKGYKKAPWSSKLVHPSTYSSMTKVVPMNTTKQTSLR